MAETPERCPTCATRVPQGAPRCPGCGRVFGEENRCPHCHAVAAVIPRGGITVCAACGKPRTGSVTLGGSELPGSMVPASRLGRSASTRAMLARGRGRMQRGFGVLALAAGVLMATLAAALFPGAAGVGLALAAALLGVGVGALSIRAGARSLQDGETEDRRAKEAAVLELASERGGRLTAAEVAEAFHVSEDAADALLTAMVGDGSTVTVDVDDEGVLRYVFLRSKSRASSKLRVEAVRVEVEDEAEVELEEPRAQRRRNRSPDGGD